MFAGVVLGIACGGVPTHPVVDERVDGFSPRRARAHYVALAGLGSRLPGSEAAVRARTYVERELRWAGAEWVGPDSGDASADHPVLAWLPGASEERVLVAAPWAPALGRTGPDDAGVATLLELARALARQPRPYTVGIAIAIVAPSEESVGGARAATQRAGEVLVEALAADPGLDALRAVLVLEPRIGASGGIARDLRSHPVFRDLFWRTAARLGHHERFPEDGGWATPEGIQGAFLSAGYGRVLALVDERPLAPSPRTRGTERAVLPEPGAFEPVGEVVHSGLLQLMERLVRVDAFSR